MPPKILQKFCPLIFAVFFAPFGFGAESIFARLELAGLDDEWQPIYKGIDYRFDALDEPRVLRLHQLRIDTRAEGIEFFTTPGNGSAAGEVNARATTTFLAEFDLEVAVNGGGFSPFPVPEGEPLQILGLSVSNGEQVSPIEGDDPALILTSSNQVRILSSPFDTEDLSDIFNGLQGWFGSEGMLLDDGQMTTTDRSVHPRTAAGVSRDGRYLYLLVVDGRQTGFSEGLSLVEMAEWMKRLGSWDAMNLDGGGSSTMVIKDPRSNGALIMNAPSGGSERFVGNHIGVDALPLDD